MFTTMELSTTKGGDEMMDIMQMGLDTQGHIVRANNEHEEDDVMFPEREDIDDRADRLYDEQEVI